MCLVFHCFCRWDPSKRMTPDQALQHEWILEMKHKTKDTKTSTNRKHRHHHHQSTDNSTSEIKGRFDSICQKLDLNDVIITISITPKKSKHCYHVLLPRELKGRIGLLFWSLCNAIYGSGLHFDRRLWRASYSPFNILGIITFQKIDNSVKENKRNQRLVVLIMISVTFTDFVLGSRRQSTMSKVKGTGVLKYFYILYNIFNVVQQINAIFILRVEHFVLKGSIL